MTRYVEHSPLSQRRGVTVVVVVVAQFVIVAAAAAHKRFQYSIICRRQTSADTTGKKRTIIWKHLGDKHQASIS